MFGARLRLPAIAGGILLMVTGSASPPQTVSPNCLPAPTWQEIAPGIDFVRVSARCYCRSGSPGIAFVRVDPSRSRIEPYHEGEFPRDPQSTVDGWQRRLGAPVILNAGLYDDTRRHLGVLRRGGDDVGGGHHRAWKGMLVSGGMGNLPPAALLDLGLAEDRTQSDHYPHAVQSMMLFDRRGEIRVRRSEKIAPRSGIAEDAQGRIYLFVTEGSFTLWETGLLLRDAGWELSMAIALDGGNEAHLAVESRSVQYRSYRGSTEADEFDPFREAVTLPAVVAVWPRTP